MSGFLQISNNTQFITSTKTNLSAFQPANMPQITINTPIVATPTINISTTNGLFHQDFNHEGQDIFVDLDLSKEIKSSILFSENSPKLSVSDEQVINIDEKGHLVEKNENGNFKFVLQKGENYVLNQEGKIDSIQHLDGTETKFLYCEADGGIFSKGTLLNATHIDSDGVLNRKFYDGSTLTVISKEIDGNDVKMLTLKDYDGNILEKKLGMNGKTEFAISSIEGRYYYEQFFHDGTSRKEEVSKLFLSKNFDINSWYDSVEIKETIHKNPDTQFFNSLNPGTKHSFLEMDEEKFGYMYVLLGKEVLQSMTPAQIHILSKLENSQLVHILEEYGEKIISYSPADLWRISR